MGVRHAGLVGRDGVATRCATSRLAGLAARVAAAALLAGAPAGALGAQVRPAPPRDTVRAPRADTAGLSPAARAARDSAAAAADTTRRELVEWAPTDSVFEALLQRQGYVITRYQGRTTTFQVGQRRIELAGDPAAVQRGEAVVVGDTIVYDDSLGIISVRRGAGGPVVLRDPARGEDLISDRITYDVRTGAGTVDAVSTTVENAGERWRVTAERAAVRRGSAAQGDSAGTSAFWGHDGSITSCELEYPHYHFEARDIKVVRGSIMVARPAVLYIGEVPVLWLPFVFQDMRSGRRSGFLSPRFGFAELVRNSANYRRSVDNLGYHFALSDYLGASVWLDWRSGAAGVAEDPGYLRYNGEMQYSWLSRFLSGRLALAYESWSDGRKNYRASWGHNQSFSERTSFRTDINWTQSTQLVRQAAYVPMLALASIRSSANYQTGAGPFSLSVGGSRSQYTGREDATTDFPTISITSQPINAGEWLTWTPGLRISNNLTEKNLVPGELGLRFGATPGDTTRLRYDRRNSTIDFQTPLKIFDFNWQNSVSIRDEDSDQPIQLTVYDAATPGDSTRRIYGRTFQTSVDWNTSINLPQLFGGTWNLTPSVGIANVDAGPFLLRSQFSGGEWVNQTKRVNFGISTSPTLYRRFGGLGPFEGFRHAIQPSLSYSYAPAANVGADYLTARGQNPATYVGALAQSAVTLNFNTALEAKLRAREADGAAAGADSAAAGRGERGTGGAGRADDKIKLLSLNFSSLTYDFIRADTLGRGLTNENFSINGRSDLLPGFDLNINYSLFNGPSSDLRSDFKPYRTGISASFSIDRSTNALALLTRVFGRPIPLLDPRATQPVDAPSDTAAALLGQQPVAGADSRIPVQQIPRGQGWRASINYTSNRSRPDLIGNVIDYDPTTICEPLRQNPINYQICLDDARRNPPLGDEGTGAGGVARLRTPPTSNVTSNMTFDLTQKWAGTWSTSYDIERSEFASHTVALQRELHDWLATFAFTQSPNGNFAFSFYISLKAAPDIKFDYDRRTFRGQGASAR